MAFLSEAKAGWLSTLFTDVQSSSTVTEEDGATLVTAQHLLRWLNSLSCWYLHLS